jgi:hypothetical protein
MVVISTPPLEAYTMKVTGTSFPQSVSVVAVKQIPFQRVKTKD